MRPFIPLIICTTAFFAIGCKKAVEAPDTIEEMMNFGFVNFDNDDDSLEALSHNLFAFVDENLEEA